MTEVQAALLIDAVNRGQYETANVRVLLEWLLLYTAIILLFTIVKAVRK